MCALLSSVEIPAFILLNCNCLQLRRLRSDRPGAVVCGTVVRQVIPRYRMQQRASDHIPG